MTDIVYCIVSHALTDIVYFVWLSLKKDYKQRPNYVQLLDHPFIVSHEQKETDVSSFVTQALDLYSEKPPATST